MAGPIRFGSGDQNRLVSRFNQANQKLKTSMDRLSTGKRIQHGKDDPAGLIAATQLQAEVTSLEAERRAGDLQAHRSAIVEASNGQVTDVLQQMHGLVTSAANGLLSSEERSALQVELDGAIDAISRIQSYTRKYVGTEASLDLSALHQLQSGGDYNVVNGDVSAAQSLLKTQLDQTLHYRARQGAEANTAEVLQQVREDQIIQHQDALSSLVDTDFASEVSKLRQSQTLVQSSLLALQYYNNHAANSMQSLLGGINLTV